MKLIIPSYNRPDTIKTPFLEVFKNFEKIILLHDDEQYQNYKKFNEYKNMQVIVTGCDDGGKAGQIRYAVDNLLSHNEWAIFADDNIDYVTGVGKEHWDKDKYTFKSSEHWDNVKSNDFIFRILELIAEADKVNAHLIGFLSTNNYFFANKKYKYFGFCHGKLTLWKKDNGFVFDNYDLRSLNDFHNTARHLLAYGVVLINDYMHPVAKYFQKGGIGSKKNRKQNRIKNIKFLTTYYPELIKIKKRKDSYPDARIVSMSAKNFIIWRKKYQEFVKNYTYDINKYKWFPNDMS